MPFHRNRTWTVSDVESVEELAEKLSQGNWTLCSAFQLRESSYLYLNDATSEDGAQEYAVVKRLPGGSFIQVESITFGWCTKEKALAYIRDVIAGKFDDDGRPVALRLEEPVGHSCGLCA